MFWNDEYDELLITSAFKRTFSKLLDRLLTRDWSRGLCWLCLYSKYVHCVENELVTTLVWCLLVGKLLGVKYSRKSSLQWVVGVNYFSSKMFIWCCLYSYGPFPVTPRIVDIMTCSCNPVMTARARIGVGINNSFSSWFILHLCNSTW